MLPGHRYAIASKSKLPAPPRRRVGRPHPLPPNAAGPPGAICATSDRRTLPPMGEQTEPSSRTGAETGGDGMGRGRSRAWIGPMRAVTRILNAGEGVNPRPVTPERSGRSAVVDCGLYVDGVRQAGDWHHSDALAAARAGDNAFVWLGLHDPDEAEMTMEVRHPRPHAGQRPGAVPLLPPLRLALTHPQPRDLAVVLLEITPMSPLLTSTSARSRRMGVGSAAVSAGGCWTAGCPGRSH
jgi:hypothetical protein